ncbi:hypothetical protein HWB60_gp069 [Mycobacterium phage TChen]|uniref:Uncharacterized protein n=1 Tax=Mycobacterium phage TChen TaxID=2163598 RepID=A0A2S1PD58_9CAUD|nr:hypothetical protein HWB60_gp069 [Mycobacterium phage TChen]AWH14499.1 hypothetical protein SEA_TCHEN_69 [Mycobacterium phage TChen]
MCDHPRSSHAPQCRVRMGVNRDDMNTYTICLCPGFEGAERGERPSCLTCPLGSREPVTRCRKFDDQTEMTLL